jgi:hypothetical protein
VEGNDKTKDANNHGVRGGSTSYVEKWWKKLYVL